MISKDMPIFSVITICWNVDKEIQKTLDSVVRQTCGSKEYIVVDGGSTDGTLEILKHYQDSIDILISEPDKGIYNAMNKGLRLAHGQYVIFMNAGDEFDSFNTLSSVQAAICNSPKEFALVYGDYIRTKGPVETQIIPARSANKAWYGMFASHQSMFYSLGFLHKQGLEYDESYKIAADYKLTLEVVHRAGTENVLHLPICVARFDLGGVSANNQNAGLREADRARKEVLGMSSVTRMGVRVLLRCARILRENSIFKSIYGFLRY